MDDLVLLVSACEKREISEISPPPLPLISHLSLISQPQTEKSAPSTTARGCWDQQSIWRIPKLEGGARPQGIRQTANLRFLPPCQTDGSHAPDQLPDRGISACLTRSQ